MDSPHLFEATVVGMDVASSGEPMVRLVDVRALKGESTPTVLVGGDGASCAYQFTVGQRYLIDAREGAAGRFAASTCSHTRPLVAAGGVVRYLLQSVPAERARVWGRVSAATMEPRERGSGPPIAGADVTLTGLVVLRARSDRKGEFAFPDVPDGEYRLAAHVPADRRDALAPLTQSFVLDSTAGCMDLDVVAPSTAGVRGLVLDGAGRPASGVRVEFFPWPYDQWVGGVVHAATTGADGRYEVAALAPGRYTGGVGVPYPSAENPVIPRLARGVDGRDVVAIGPGESLSLPPLLAVPAPAIAVSGRLATDADTPVAGIMLVLQLLDGLPSVRTLGGTSGPDGRFTLSAHRGVRYRVLLEGGREIVGQGIFTAGDEEIEIRVTPKR